MVVRKSAPGCHEAIYMHNCNWCVGLVVQREKLCLERVFLACEMICHWDSGWDLGQLAAE